MPCFIRIITKLIRERIIVPYERVALIRSFFYKFFNRSMDGLYIYHNFLRRIKEEEKCI